MGRTAAERRAKRKLKKAAESTNRGDKNTYPEVRRHEQPPTSDLHFAIDDLKKAAENDSEMAKIIGKFIEPFEDSEPARNEHFDKAEDDFSDFSSDSFSSHEEDEREKMSNKKRRKTMRISLAELKAFAGHPEIIEIEDTTAKFPKLLAQLKCAPNTIPVPRHWSRKRKYLAGKRGFVKPPFDLPQFIKDTGVVEEREAVRAIDNHKSLKAKARDRMHPKLGRLAVNYERLYDAFFKYQTKPPLSGFGQVFYEGKDYHYGHHQTAVASNTKGIRPGQLSDTLREALGVTGSLAPPPWLFNMQRYGPPPSYPHLRLPGVNAPLPEGAQWGYHPGGWGRPPMDDALMNERRDGEQAIDPLLLKPVERMAWGELQPEPVDQ